MFSHIFLTLKEKFFEKNYWCFHESSKKSFFTLGKHTFPQANLASRRVIWVLINNPFCSQDTHRKPFIIFAIVSRLWTNKLQEFLPQSKDIEFTWNVLSSNFEALKYSSALTNKISFWKLPLPPNLRSHSTSTFNIIIHI